ncbi:MAG: hypothetical protein IPL61_01295 [Myxococcales bacterium]|nr:hypothetical protein [Myxococcales bacterium]
MGMRLAVLVCLAVALFPARAGATATGAGLFVQAQPVPVVESSIEIDVHLGVARGVVRQRFHNDRAVAVEGVYVFPLPPGAAVEAMEATVGGTKVRGVIARRAEAAAAYQDAVAAGRAAALTEVERPGMFTQSLAPIPAGGDVVVTLRWQAVLPRHDGIWELAHPLVVGPRFVPGTATGQPTHGSGTAVDTDRAPDGSRVTPPTGAGAATPFHVRLALDDAADVVSPTHPIAVAAAGSGAAVTVDDTRGDRELIVRWRSHQAEQVRAFVEPAGGGAYVAVLIEPAADAAPPVRATRRWVVVVDRSRSLDGAAAAAARAVGRTLIDALPAGDTVAIAGLGQAPARATLDRAEARRVLAALPTGTSDLTRALAVTLARLPRDPALQVVLITDGLVADDAAAIERAAAGGLPIHTIGVGAAPNRWLLAAIAARTGATVGVLGSLDDAAAVVATILASDRAAPVTVDWRTPAVVDTEASTTRVGPGQAALLVAVDPAGVPSGEIEISIGPRKLRAKLERGSSAILPSTWAALRVARLYAAGDRDAATLLALERGIVAPTTALIASTTRADEPVRSVIAVPVPAPAGTRRDALREEQRERTFEDVVDARRPTPATAPQPPPRPDLSLDSDSTTVSGGDSGGGVATAGIADDEAEAQAPEAQRAYASDVGASESVLRRALDRHFLVASLGFGVRVDARVPAAHLSLGSYWRLPRFYALGVRLELTGAPVDDTALGAAALVSLTTTARLPVRLDAGVGVGWSDAAAAAYDVGLLIGRQGIGLALRLTGLAGPGTNTVTVSAGVEAAF